MNQFTDNTSNLAGSLTGNTATSNAPAFSFNALPTVGQPGQSLFNAGNPTTGLTQNLANQQTTNSLITGTTNQSNLLNTSTTANKPNTNTGFNLNFGQTGFNLNFGQTNTGGASLAGNTATSNAPAFSLNTVPTSTAAQPGFSLFNAGNPTTGLTQSLTNQPTTNSSITNQPNLLNTSNTANKAFTGFNFGQTTSATTTTTANKPTTATGFNLNFGQTIGQTTPAATSTTTSLTTVSTTPSQITSSLTTPSTTTISNQTQQQSQQQQSQQQSQQQQPPQQQQPTQLTFKQLEGYINVWLNELNQMESDFQTQSQTINSWDSLLVNNGLKITNLNESLDLLKEEHKRIDQQLDFVISQQNELEQLLEPLEKIQVDFNVNDTASTEREFTYSLVDTVSNDLQGIGTELQNFIKKLNETKANQDLNDPLSSIGKILNSHIDALQYIEHQINVLKRNVEA